MARDYIFEKKGVFTEGYLTPEEIKTYEKQYGELIGVETDGILIKAEKGRNYGTDQQRNSGEI